MDNMPNLWKQNQESAMSDVLQGYGRVTEEPLSWFIEHPGETIAVTGHELTLPGPYGSTWRIINASGVLSYVPPPEVDVEVEKGRYER